MIREDREVLCELKAVTTHVTDFLLSVLGAEPVNPEAQRELAEHLLAVGSLLRDRSEQGHVINGYVNGIAAVKVEPACHERATRMS